MATTQQTNKDIIRRLNDEVWSDGNLGLIEEFIASEYIEHNTASPQEIRGPEGYRENVKMLRTAFPDMETDSEDLIAEGEKVLYYYTIHGTHEGELMGIPPTNEEVEFSGMGIARFEDGVIVEGWSVPDVFSMLQQVGLVEPPEGM